MIYTFTNVQQYTNNQNITGYFSVLSNSQVAVILQVSAGVATNRDEELNDIYRKTQQYVNRFNTMNNPEKEHQEVVDELDNLQEYVYCYLIFLLLIVCVLVGIIS